ncbi:MAG: hypothetical protein ABIK61_06395 [candidate division WOR-3 bacterium]
MLNKIATLALLGLVAVASAVTYTLTLETNPAGLLTPPTGAGDYEEGTYADISTVSRNSLGDGYVYVFTDWSTEVMSEITDPYALATTVLMDATKTVTANHQKMEEIYTAKSQGYWKNRDGQMELTLDDATYLNTLTPWLDYFNTTDLNEFKRQVKTYLTPKPKDPMQKKLGMQLLTAILNDLHNYLDPTREVWYDADMDGVYDAGENLLISDIITGAINAWSSGIDQAYYKDLLDMINNNMLLYIVY